MFGSRPLILVSLLCAAALAACGEKATAPTVDCSSATVPTYAQLSILPLCTSCHSSDLSGQARENAPGSINFNTYAASKAFAASAAAQINSGLMPPGNDPQPTAAEKAAFYTWALCGTPQ